MTTNLPSRYHFNMDSFFIFGAKYLFILSLILPLFQFYQSEKVERKRLIIYGILSALLAFILSLIAREIYFNPRPFVVGNFTPLVPHEPDNGFPSDHTLLVAAIASIMTPVHRRLALYLWLLAIVVALSRIYVGVHHPLDVIGSIIIAILSSLAAYAIIHNIWNKNKTN